MSTLIRAIAVKGCGLGLISMSFASQRSYCDKPLSSSNPLLMQSGLPRFKEIEPSHVEPAITHDIDNLRSGFKSFEENLKKKNSYSDVVEKLEKLEAPLSYSWGVTNNLMHVKNSDELRSAFSKMQPEVVKIRQTLSQSQLVYNALNSIKDDVNYWQRLEEAQRRIVDASIRSMKTSGVGLPQEQREKFSKLQSEVSELATKFTNNVMDSTKSFQLIITDKSKVEGLPESALALAAQQASRSGHEGATAESGPWMLTLDMPSYLPSMQHLKDRTLREQLYRAFISRASEGEKNNVPVIQRILQIKQEMSKMLGYKCYAELSLASKMAPNADKVMELINMLREKAYPAAQRELEELKAFAKKQGFQETMNLWDVPYWSERMRESLYEFEEESLRPYFALPIVLKGLFDLAHRLFQIDIVEAKEGDAQVWHSDVKFFHVMDSKSGKHIASFYLDPYSRPAEKNGGAWMDVCLGRSKVMSRIPVAYLNCNGSPPVGDKPSLMTFREVETLFHEFGHGLQHMLTDVEHGDAAGISNVEWDAVELPSQFMENFCYDKKTLYGFAKHFETGEPLPQELFEKIKAAKNFQAGMQMVRQLYFGAMDMELHSLNYDPNGSKTPFQVQHEIAQRFTVMRPLQEDRFLCSFSHIFGGGYSAGYYSYKWAEVMSADAFGAFEEVGLDNEDKVRETGLRFRKTVLGMGGGRHPSEVYRLFRGRDPSPEALLRHSGLSN